MQHARKRQNEQNMSVKIGKMACLERLISFCHLKRMRRQDRTHAAVVSHVTSLLLSEGWHANTYWSAHSREKVSLA